MGIRDTRMEAKALIERWPMDERTRQALIAKMTQIMLTAKPREAIAAAKALLAAEGQNQSDEHKKLDEFSRKLLQFAARFGIQPVDEQAGIGVAGTSSIDADGTTASFADESSESEVEATDEGNAAEIAADAESTDGSEAESDIDESETDE